MTKTSELDAGQKSIYNASDAFRRSFASTRAKLGLNDNSVNTLFSSASVTGRAQYLVPDRANIVSH
jgi:hypothetical protein